jgi:hypothetical protein
MNLSRAAANRNVRFQMADIRRLHGVRDNLARGVCRGELREIAMASPCARGRSHARHIDCSLTRSDQLFGYQQSTIRSHSRQSDLRCRFSTIGSQM